MTSDGRRLLIYTYRLFCNKSLGMTDSQAAEKLTSFSIEKNFCEPRAALKGGSLKAMSTRGGSKPNEWMLKGAYYFLQSQGFVPETDGQKKGFLEAEELFNAAEQKV